MYFRCTLALLKTLNCNCNLWKLYLRNVSKRGEEKREIGEMGSVRERMSMRGGVRDRALIWDGGRGVIT